MTNYTVKNGRRDFLLTLARGIATLAAGSLPARVLAQSTGGPPLSISTIGAGREGGALGALFVKAGHRVMFSSRHPDTLTGSWTNWVRRPAPERLRKPSNLAMS
jgi:8-hydroxy-5-deazaflavin:NADPH oxidoreductase